MDGRYPVGHPWMSVLFSIGPGGLDGQRPIEIGDGRIAHHIHHHCGQVGGGDDGPSFGKEGHRNPRLLTTSTEGTENAVPSVEQPKNHEIYCIHLFKDNEYESKLEEHCALCDSCD